MRGAVMHREHILVVPPAARKLQIALLLTALILVAEVVTGFLANSLALLSDAGHVLMDLFALGLSWVAVHQSSRAAAGRMTYGYHRIGILVAVINAVAVVVVALFIFIEAARRLQETPEVRGNILLAMALVGGLVNLVVAWVLHGEIRGSLNVRSAFLHVLGDLLGSLGVLVAAVAIVAAGWLWMDAAVSVLIGVIILVGAVRILREAIHIFLEASPAHIDMDELVAEIVALPGVEGIHDLHVWSITPNIHALSCHLLVENQTISQGCLLLERVNELL
ncbi:MAG: cation diffusion facilitator family transporter, partial [Dehalococcoidia bacterium]|nr:cation diffusion facilitator family transporter [Dehalococcoidia bacterium]